MASSVQNSQAKILEIPVTVQGARAVEGEGRRELFTETTKTTLVFEKGAVVSLKSKVTSGQCVFVRNEQTGREIMCRVIESRQTGELNYADLEFTSYGPDFWDPPDNLPDAKKSVAEQSATQSSVAQQSATQPAPAMSVASPQERPQMAASILDGQPFDTRLDAQQKIARALEQLMSPNEPAPLPGESPAAENSAVATEQHATPIVADAPPDELAAIATSAGEVSAAALVKRSDGSEEEEPAESHAAAPQRAKTDQLPDHTPETEPASESEPDTEKDSVQLAALIAIDERKRAKREATAKTKAESADASPDAPQSAEALLDQQTGALAPEAGAASIVSRAVWALKFGDPKIRIGAGIAAAVLFISTLGFALHAKRVAAHNAHGSNLPSAAWSGSKQPVANLVASTSAAQPTSAVAANSISGSKLSGSKAAGVSVNPPSRLADVKVADTNKSAAATESSAAVGGANGVAADHAAERRKHAAPSGPAAGEVTPPQIVSGPQPAFPAWANGMDGMGDDPVVLLEATIDENGKLTNTRVLSGPQGSPTRSAKGCGALDFRSCHEAGRHVGGHTHGAHRGVSALAAARLIPENSHFESLRREQRNHKIS